MHYGEIKKCDIANGEGVRVSLFVSGCTLHCPGCFNEETWNFEYGTPFTPQTEDEIFRELDQPYVNGLSILGGEPLERRNQRELLPIVKRLMAAHPTKTLWVYSGYVLEDDILPEDGAAHCEATDELLGLIDVLVDGSFVQEEHDITLAFRGSANQRIMDLAATLEAGEPVLHRLPLRGM